MICLAIDDKAEGFIGKLAYSKRRVLLGNYSVFLGFATEAVAFAGFPETLIPSTMEH